MAKGDKGVGGHSAIRPLSIPIECHTSNLSGSIRKFILERANSSPTYPGTTSKVNGDANRIGDGCASNSVPSLSAVLFQVSVDGHQLGSMVAPWMDGACWHIAAAAKSNV